MSTVPILTGTAFEIVGLGFVFGELADIRSRELGIPTPWTRIASRFPRKQRDTPKPATTPANLGEMRATATSSASMKLTTGRRLAPRDAPIQTRVDAIEDYVQWKVGEMEAANEALRRGHQDVLDGAHRRAAQTDAVVKRFADAIEAELADREAKRKEQIRASLRPQAFGASCVLIGLVLGTIGNLF
ncbi:MAG: hypothetical protein JSS99_07180 [Actinobacteria bacterium]|nr:hypothetical protein [Actinomycetota bacterium]